MFVPLGLECIPAFDQMALRLFAFLATASERFPQFTVVIKQLRARGLDALLCCGDIQSMHGLGKDLLDDQPGMVQRLRENTRWFRQALREL